MVNRTMLNSWGELTSQGVAVCVEKMLDRKINELPQWMINHLEQSSSCRSRVSFLLEHEKEQLTNKTIRAGIDANTSILRTKQATTCNHSLQLITPLENDVCIGTILFQFNIPLKKRTKLHIHNHTDKRILDVEIPPGNTTYQFTPKNLETGIYYYVIEVKTTIIFNYFYYCTREDKKSMMIGVNTSYSL